MEIRTQSSTSMHPCNYRFFKTTIYQRQHESELHKRGCSIPCPFQIFWIRNNDNLSLQSYLLVNWSGDNFFQVHLQNPINDIISRVLLSLRDNLTWSLILKLVIRMETTLRWTWLSTLLCTSVWLKHNEWGQDLKPINIHHTE